MEDLNEKIYSKILQIAETTAKQEVKLGHIDEHLKGINGKVHDHCLRIRSLENKSVKFIGAVVGATFIVSIFWTVVQSNLFDNLLK